MKIFKTPMYCLLLVGMMAACQNHQSVSKDFITGLTLKGSGLTSETVYLSDGESSIQRNEFIYGEKLYVIFDDVRGFHKKDDRVLPGMELIVKNRKGESLIHEGDLYHGETTGFDISPLQLQANLLIANPLHSNDIYTFNVRIWDKNGEGEIKANFRFKVVSNSKIELVAENIDHKEIYLYSSKYKRVVTDNEIEIGETVLVAMEGLEGFTSEGGKTMIGVRLKAVDNNGTVIVEEPDLAGNQLIDTAVLKDAINPSLVISDPSVVSPVKCTVEVWDKRSENRIMLETSLIVQ